MEWLVKSIHRCSTHCHGNWPWKASAEKCVSLLQDSLSQALDTFMQDATVKFLYGYPTQQA